MCQGDPIGADVLVAIMGPSELAESGLLIASCLFKINYNM